MGDRVGQLLSLDSGRRPDAPIPILCPCTGEFPWLWHSERFNWVWCCPGIGLGKEGLLHTGAGQTGPDLGPQPCSWGASGWAVGLGPGLSCKTWPIPLTSWCFPLQPKSSTSFQVGKRGNQGPSGWDGGRGWAGGWGGRLRGLGEPAPGPQPRPLPSHCRHGGLPAEQRVQQRRGLSPQVPL